MYRERDMTFGFSDPSMPLLNAARRGVVIGKEMSSIPILDRRHAFDRGGQRGRRKSGGDVKRISIVAVGTQIPRNI